MAVPSSLAILFFLSSYDFFVASADEAFLNAADFALLALVILVLRFSAVLVNVSKLASSPRFCAFAMFVSIASVASVVSSVFLLISFVSFLVNPVVSCVFLFPAKILTMLPTVPKIPSPPVIAANILAILAPVF